MELVAFSGYARAGKDEAAKALEVLGFQRVAFADKLREVLYALNPVVDYYRSFEYTGPIYVQNVIDEHGWNGYKETPYGPEIRRLLQRLGTEAGRQALWDSIWIDAALDNRPEGKYVVTDARFVNEAEAIRSRGGKIYRITRTGVGPANDHPSETSLDDYSFDGFIANDSTVEEFHEKVRSTVLEGRI